MSFFSCLAPVFCFYDCESFTFHQGLNPAASWVPFCVKITCSHRARVAFFRVLPPTLQRHAAGLTSDSKLLIVVNVCF